MGQDLVLDVLTVNRRAQTPITGSSGWRDRHESVLLTPKECL
jgi:hypothetical protein